MSRSKVIDVLNRLLAIQRFTLVSYLNEAAPWMHSGNESFVKAIQGIVHDQEHYAQMLAEAIDDRDCSLQPGTFPKAFTPLNHLDLDYLLTRLIEHQQRDIQVTEQCVSELGEDSPVSDLASEVLESELTWKF